MAYSTPISHPTSPYLQENPRIYLNYSDCSDQSARDLNRNSGTFSSPAGPRLNRPQSQGSDSPTLPPLIPTTPRNTRDTLRVTIDTNHSEPQMNYHFSPTGKLLDSPHRTRTPSKGILRAPSAGMFSPNALKGPVQPSHPSRLSASFDRPGSSASQTASARDAFPTSHDLSGIRGLAGTGSGPHGFGVRPGSAGNHPSSASANRPGSALLRPSSGNNARPGSGPAVSGRSTSPGHFTQPAPNAQSPASSRLGTPSQWGNTTATHGGGYGVDPIQLPSTPGNLFTLSPSSQYPTSIITPIGTQLNQNDSFSVGSGSTTSGPSSLSPSNNSIHSSNRADSPSNRHKHGAEAVDPNMQTTTPLFQATTRDDNYADLLGPNYSNANQSSHHYTNLEVDLYTNPYGIPPGTSLEDLYEADDHTLLQHARAHSQSLAAQAGHANTFHQTQPLHQRQAVNGLWNVPVAATYPNPLNGMPSPGTAGMAVTRRTSGPMRGGLGGSMYEGQSSTMRSSKRNTINAEPIRPTQVLSEYAERKAKKDKKEYDMQMGLHMIDKKRKDKIYLNMTRHQDKHLLRDKPHVARAELEVLRYKQNAALQSRVRFEGLVERRRQGRERVVGSQAELNRLQQVHFTERENVRRSIFRDVVKTEVEFLEAMKRMGIRTVAGLADAFA